MKTPETGMKHFQFYSNNLHLERASQIAIPGRTEMLRGTVFDILSEVSI